MDVKAEHIVDGAKTEGDTDAHCGEGAGASGKWAAALVRRRTPSSAPIAASSYLPSIACSSHSQEQRAGLRDIGECYVLLCGRNTTAGERDVG
jgi:hypothetical protein